MLSYDLLDIINMIITGMKNISLLNLLRIERQLYNQYNNMEMI
jgi:hypothetical protein